MMGSILASTKISSVLSKRWIVSHMKGQDILDNLHIERRYINIPEIITIFFWGETTYFGDEDKNIQLNKG